LKTKNKKNFYELLFLIFPSFGWLLFFFLIPLIIALIYSFNYKGTHGGVIPGFTLEHYKNVFSGQYIKIFLNSLTLASITTALTILIGYPVAYFMAASNSKLKSILMFFVILPFWTNFLIRVYSFIMILGREGLINKTLMWSGMISEPLSLLNSTFAVYLGFIYYNLPYMIIPIFSALDKMDVSLIEASMDLGAGKKRTFFKITFPQSIPGVVAGIVFVFIPTLGNFVIPDLLGGKDNYIIGNLITLQFQQGRNWPLGSALSSVLIFLAMIFISLYIRYYNPSKSKKMIEV